MFDRGTKKPLAPRPPLGTHEGVELSVCVKENCSPVGSLIKSETGIRPGGKMT